MNPSDDMDTELAEGISLLLGGLSLTDVTNEAWENESISGNPVATEGLMVHKTNQNNMIRTTAIPATYPLYNKIPTSLEYEAFTLASSGETLQRPPVSIVDMSASGRGFGLVALRSIRRGEVIYTERASVACQIPGFTKTVKACQNCFRSLEPIHSCQQSAHHILPNPELWPVPDIELLPDARSLRPDHSDIQQYRSDRYGRVECTLCKYWFCSESCRADFERTLGSCCILQRVMNELPRLLKVTEDDEHVEVDPAIPLAVRMFIFSLTLFRKNQTTWEKGVFFDGLCGDASDKDSLQLGKPIEDNGTVRYQLDSIYVFLARAVGVTMAEQHIFSLEYFTKLASKGARNGFGIITRSPFRSYYESLLRTVGGRGSHKHDSIKRQVALALGSESGMLERHMDRDVDKRVAVEIAAIFSLTARINHSCDPNAQVRSQEFTDYHIDLVATTDISELDEITISYVPIVKGSVGSSRRQRQRALEAKYLFTCDCHLCSPRIE